MAYENLEKSNGDDVNLEQSRALLSRLRSLPSIGRLVIDLDAQINDTADTQIILLDGDVLYVPAIPQEVIVSGEVQFPTSHLADTSLRLMDYIERSGGFTERSNEDLIAVVKSNGMVIQQKEGNKWFSSTKQFGNVSAGDMIVVPVKIELPSRWLEKLSTSTQILYQLSIAAAAVHSF